ncbi:DUF397 domain-containing protein [Streptomyces sp. NPDC057486]|uniref:DUF397 domain-containing protein n=1 Tax=Streptomyces sp. NPDC057486 TaxID=3346145 RepID=UPI0036768C7D
MADGAPDLVPVRDSKITGGPVLVFRATGRMSFIKGVKSHAFCRSSAGTSKVRPIGPPPLPASAARVAEAHERWWTEPGLHIFRSAGR